MRVAAVIALALVSCTRTVYLQPAGKGEPRCAVQYQWIKPPAAIVGGYDSLLVEIHMCPVFVPQRHREIKYDNG